MLRVGRGHADSGVGGLNLYAFLDNSSINRWDNWGLYDCDTWTEWSNAVGGAFMDGLSDGAAGVADALTGGLSAKFRDAYGINDINDDTNYYTGYYSGNFALESISAAMGTAAGNYVSEAVGAAAARSVANEAAGRAVAVEIAQGTAFQENTRNSLSALQKIKDGATVYRQGEFDVQNTTNAQYWSLQNPKITTNYAERMGMPATNSIDWIMGGTVKKDASVITRSSPGIGKNPGGSTEAVVSPGGVQIDWFHMP